MSDQRKSQRVVIVGGGITGAYAAYFLGIAGVRVSLVEPDPIGRHASGENPGGLNPMHGKGIPGAMEALNREAFALHLGHHAAIERLSGIPFHWRRPPRIHVALDAADLPGLETLEVLHHVASGFSARWLEPSALHALDTGLAADAIVGLWTEGNAKVDAESYTRAVVAAAVQQGARVVSQRVVDLTSTTAGSVAAVVLANGERIACDGVVVATGPWVEGPERWLGCALPVEPVKGELLFVRVEGEPPAHGYAWREAAVYGNGTVTLWLGGNVAREGFDVTPTAAARKLILAGVERLYPGLRVAEVLKQTAALRPMAADELPLVGMAPGWSNVCVALGGGRKGMLLGSAMGLAASELLTTGRTGMPVACCAPGRFTVESRKSPQE